MVSAFSASQRTRPYSNEFIVNCNYAYVNQSELNQKLKCDWEFYAKGPRCCLGRAQTHFNFHIDWAQKFLPRRTPIPLSYLHILRLHYSLKSSKRPAQIEHVTPWRLRPLRPCRPGLCLFFNFIVTKITLMIIVFVLFISFSFFILSCGFAIWLKFIRLTMYRSMLHGCRYFVISFFVRSFAFI